MLLEPDREALREHCAQRKAAILDALDDKNPKGTAGTGTGATSATANSGTQGKQRTISKWNRGKLTARIEKLGLSRDTVTAWVKQQWGVEDLDEITLDQFKELDGPLEQLAEAARNETKDQAISQTRVTELTDFIHQHGLSAEDVKHEAGVKALHDITNGQLKEVWKHLYELAQPKQQDTPRENLPGMATYLKHEEKAGRSGTTGT